MIVWQENYSYNGYNKQVSCNLNYKNMNEDLLEELKSELQSKDELIRQTALTCLLRLGSGQDIYEIIRQISEEDESPNLRYLAKKGLSKLNIKSRPEFEQARDLIRKLLENIGPKRLEVYHRVLRGKDSFLKLEMINLLISEHLSSAKIDNDCNNALVELLKEQLSKEKDLFLVAQYVKALGYFGTNKDINLLQRLLQNKNPRIVANAIEALQNIDEITAMNMVFPLLHHNDNRVRGNAILLVHSQDPARALKELAKMASSEKLWMRSSALYCIKSLNFDEKEQYLAQMFCDESDDSIINDIICWMSLNGTQISAVALRQKIESSGDDLRESLKLTLDKCLKRCNFSSEDLEKAVLDSNQLREENIANEIKDRAPKTIDNNCESDYGNFSSKIISVLKLSIILTLIIVTINFLFNLLTAKNTVSPFGSSLNNISNSKDFKNYIAANHIKSNGLYLEASKIFEDLLEKYPKDSQLILDYSELLSSMGRNQECMVYLSESQAIIKNKSRYYRILAQATLHSTKDKNQVDELYQYAINLYPDNSRLLNDALLFYEMINHQEKMHEIRTILHSRVYK